MRTDTHAVKFVYSFNSLPDENNDHYFYKTDSTKISKGGDDSETNPENRIYYALQAVFKKPHWS